MSVTTNYSINGIDLSNILQPYTQFKTLNNTIQFLYIAASQNQTYITGVNQGDSQVHVSSNSGQTWTGYALTGATMLNCIAVSSTGQYMLTANAGGDIYVSNNYGTSWTPLVYSGLLWQTAYVSQTGQYMVIGSAGGTLFYSNNYGVSFVSSTSSGTMYWYSICSNLSASYIFAAGGNGIKYSTNYGLSWTSLNTSLNCRSISCNSDGTKLIVGTYNAGVYILDSSGTTWTTVKTTLPSTISSSSYQYYSVSSDLSGQNLVASNLEIPSETKGFMYYSTDYGTTWNKLNGTAGSTVTTSITSINSNSFIFNNYISFGLYKYYLFNYSIPNTNLYVLGTELTNYFLPPQGTSTIYSASWNSTTNFYSLNNINILTNFAPLTTIYNTPGTFSYTLKNSTVRWAALLVAGGGGGMGGTQYSGGNNGAGGGGGSSGQWLFAYSNTPITNQTLSITVGSGGKGSTGVDNSSAYQYPLNQPTAGGYSSIVINSTTELLVNGGNPGQGFTSGNVGSAGGLANTNSITFNSSAMIIYYYNNGVNGNKGSNATSGHPPGGSGGVNSFSSIGINNNFSYITNTQNTITLSNYGEGGYGGYGEGTSGNANGCQNGFDANGGLVILFEYQLPSTFTTTLETSKLITNTTYDLINLANTINFPYGYKYINIYLYGSGGNASQVGSGTYDSGGGGGGGYIFAKNIPFMSSNIEITNIQYEIGTGGSSQSTIVIIYYSDGSYINLNAGGGQSTGNNGSTIGAAGGVSSFTNTTTFYSNSNILLVNGKAGGNQNSTGASNGYTSSGSGGNSSNPASNSSYASNTFIGNDGIKYTIESYGGGSNQVVSGYGSGGAATPANFSSNAPAYRYGSQGVILYTLDINTI
jgi:hypothetical protein